MSEEHISLSLTKLPELKQLKSPECLEALLNTKVPDEFTWRTFGGDQVEKGGSRDQGLCGGCWAFAIAGTMGDRCALEFGLQAPYPSTEWILDTQTKLNNGISGCMGGSVIQFAIWLGDSQEKVAFEKCWPFKDTPKEGVDINKCCHNTCDPEDPFTESGISIEPASVGNRVYTKFFGVDVLSPRTPGKLTRQEFDTIIKDIQINILATGPVATVIFSYNDFTEYWSGPAKDGVIYKHEWSPASSGYGHSMVIVGWGVQNGQRYWEVRNSWGKGGWKDGYAKIAFSDYDKPETWVGVDVPIYINGTYNCGAVSVRTKPLPDKYLRDGVVKKSESTNVNLLELSRTFIEGFEGLQSVCPNYEGFRVGNSETAIQWLNRETFTTSPQHFLYMPVEPDVGVILPPQSEASQSQNGVSGMKWWQYVLLGILIIVVILVPKYLAPT